MPLEPLRTESLEQFRVGLTHGSCLASVCGIHSVYNVSSGIVISVSEFCLHLANFLDALIPFPSILYY
jgi:hypothetical protein